MSLLISTAVLTWCLGISTASPQIYNGAVNFPDAARNKKEVEFSDETFISPCPDNRDFCVQIHDYPSRIQLSRTASVNQFVKNKVFEKREQLSARSSFTLTEESRACRHRSSVVYPKKAKNTNGKFMFIVNEKEYRQAVQIEQCENEEGTCETDGDAPQMNVGSTVCRQKYTTYKLYAVNATGHQVYDSFSLPSSCLCYHKSSFSIRGGPFEPGQVEPRSGTRSSSKLPTCPSKAPTFQQNIQQFPNEKFSKSKFRPTASSRITFGSGRKRRQSDQRGARQQRPSLSPTGCQGSYCSSDADYPSDLITSVIRQDATLSARLFQDVFNSQCIGQDSQVRLKFLPTEESLCESRPKVVYPKAAMNEKQEWRFVVNLDNYTQSVEVEECQDQESRQTFGQVDGARENQTTFGVCLYSGAEGHNPDFTVCKQLYTQHKLLAFSPDSELVVDTFMLPSSCACFVRRDFDIGFRSGATGESSSFTFG